MTGDGQLARTPVNEVAVLEVLLFLLIKAIWIGLSFAVITLGASALIYLPVALFERMRQGFRITWLLGLTTLAAFLFSLWRVAGPIVLVYVLVLIGVGLLLVQYVKLGSEDPQ